MCMLVWSDTPYLCCVFFHMYSYCCCVFIKHYIYSLHQVSSLISTCTHTCTRTCSSICFYWSGGIGCKILTKKVTLTDSFMASVEDLYDAFITEQVYKHVHVNCFTCVLSHFILRFQLVEAFTRSKATINPHKGGSFSILDGQITGEFVELVCTYIHLQCRTLL